MLTVLLAECVSSLLLHRDVNALFNSCQSDWSTVSVFFHLCDGPVLNHLLTPHLQTSTRGFFSKDVSAVVFMSSFLVGETRPLPLLQRCPALYLVFLMPGSICLPSGHGSSEAPGLGPSAPALLLSPLWGRLGLQESGCMLLTKRGLQSARPRFESLSWEGRLEGKMVGVGGWKGADAVRVKDLQAVGGTEDSTGFRLRQAWVCCKAALPAVGCRSISECVFSSVNMWLKRGY